MTALQTAFLTSAALPLTAARPRTALCARRTLVMCEPRVQKPSAAELTRQKLSETEPLVKFRRQTEYLDQDTSFTYTRGVKKGSLDIWLITGVLTFLVPLVGFAIGVATGNIDVNPRMLPLSLLKSAMGCPILIELKNGETYNAKLRNMDLWMNLTLVDAIRTSSDGSSFWTVPSVLIRGNTIKYIRVPELVLSILEDERAARQQAHQRSRMRKSGGGRSRSSGGRKGSGGAGGGARGGTSADRRSEPKWLR